MIWEEAKPDLETAGAMSFVEFVGIEAIGCVLAVIVLIQLGLELRSIYLSDLASRGGVFLQVQGRHRHGKPKTESPEL